MEKSLDRVMQQIFTCNRGEKIQCGSGKDRQVNGNTIHSPRVTELEKLLEIALKTGKESIILSIEFAVCDHLRLLPPNHENNP
ncbi:unnamed protein product [Allacma fusca]|uniref:Uncharacterized protein n=1 Tax=Allacma fusca TaxID=39272 RepID=A0A8J2PEU7_9HEXA|nr:unnamed protein product [Allacma fusca]